MHSCTIKLKHLYFTLKLKTAMETQLMLPSPEVATCPWSHPAVTLWQLWEATTPDSYWKWMDRLMDGGMDGSNIIGISCEVWDRNDKNPPQSFSFKDKEALTFYQAASSALASCFRWEKKPIKAESHMKKQASCRRRLKISPVYFTSDYFQHVKGRRRLIYELPLPSEQASTEGGHKGGRRRGAGGAYQRMRPMEPRVSFQDLITREKNWGGEIKRQKLLVSGSVTSTHKRRL